MTGNKYILIDEEFQHKVLKDLSELKQLIFQNYSHQTIKSNNELMDSADLIKYLKVDRRTIYKHRASGMPFVRKQNGKLYFWKAEIDKYFEKPDSKQDEHI